MSRVHGGRKAVTTLVLLVGFAAVGVFATPSLGKATSLSPRRGQGSAPIALALDSDASPDDPLLDDALWLAKNMGITVDDAIVRLQTQVLAGQLEQELTKDLSGSFGGLWIEQEPEFRVVVSLTEGKDDVLEPYVSGTPLAPLTSVATAKYPLDALIGWASSFLAASDAKFDLTVDIPKNSVIVIADSMETKDELESELETLETQPPFGSFEFRVGELAQPTINMYGGLALSSCTSGYSTRTTTGGQRGVATAGHCASAQSYLGNALPLVADDHQGNQDVQWHSLPSGLTAMPWAFDGIAGGSTPNYRIITGTLGRSGQPVGAMVCGYGKTTHYRCGSIVWKNYAPSYITSPQPTFMTLHQNGIDLTEPGDSGGPWFAGGVAYGIHSGETSGTDAIYMAINYISSLNIAVLT